jgi:hypothetical protein
VNTCPMAVSSGIYGRPRSGVLVDVLGIAAHCYVH